MHLYCDLFLNSEPLWYGVACINNEFIDSYPYLGFVGHLMFTDTQGTTDPQYQGLGPGGRYLLLYTADGTGADAVQVPLQAIPSQQFDVQLGTQYCTLSVYSL
jgi:hypothetical protein